MKLKQFAWMLMVLCLLLNSLSPLSFAETTDSDSAPTPAELLMKYGFITGINGDPMVRNPITRAEVAVIMAELNNAKLEASVFALPPKFSDVYANDWFAPYISYGEAHGYLGGYPDGTFRPHKHVSAQEFAAFMMNAMGYNGDYTYDSVIGFASTQGVHVTGSGASFLRGNAFDALWEVVNLPMKGEEVTIGQNLGKLTEVVDSNSDIYTPSIADKIDGKNLNDFIYEVEVTGRRSIEVSFQKAVSDTDHMLFTVSRLTHQVIEKPKIEIPIYVDWNTSDTKATLSTAGEMILGDYEVLVNDVSTKEPTLHGPFYVKIEKEEVDEVVIDSEYLHRINDYMGTIGFKVFNQFGKDITNSDLAKGLDIMSTTSVSKPSISYSTGVITIQHGSEDSDSYKLSDLDHFRIIVTDPKTGFYFNKMIKVSDTNSGITTVKINGIVDQYGNTANFIYDTEKDYYLDVVIVDAYGNEVRDASLLDVVNTDGKETLTVKSGNESLVKITKTTHPINTSEIAFKIDFVEKPVYNTPIMFTAYSTLADDSNNLATYMATLRVPE